MGSAVTAGGFCSEIVISIISTSQISFLMSVNHYPNFVERKRGWCQAREVAESSIQAESIVCSVEFRQLNSKAN